MRMSLDVIPRMVGKTARDNVDQVMGIMNNTTWPVFMVGPSGSGKTLTAMNCAKLYAEKHNVPAFYIQLSPDQTKTTVILGYRLIAGTLKPVKGIVAQCMEAGGVLVVDEATHTTQEMLLMFNSVLDRTSVTSVGEEIVYAKDSFRVIFCSNDSQYAGNVRLPQSFAQRLVTFYFDYPSYEDEVKIAARIAKEEFTGTMDVPDSVVKYITSIVRELRTPQFPLSARNAAIATIRLAIASKDKCDDISDYFSKGQNPESMRRVIAKRVLGRDAKNNYELTSGEVGEFLTYVSKISIPVFKEIVMSACMFYLDVDGMELNRDTMKTKIESKII